MLNDDGTAASRKEVSHYEMWREFPAWNRAAHGANGRFRLDARNGDATLYQISYDGKDTWNDKGRVEQAEASREWSENFGFGIIRFALDDGFVLTRMADDQVEGRAAWTVRVTDPGGAATMLTLYIGGNATCLRSLRVLNSKTAIAACSNTESVNGVTSRGPPAVSRRAIISPRVARPPGLCLRRRSLA